MKEGTYERLGPTPEDVHKPARGSTAVEANGGFSTRRGFLQGSAIAAVGLASAGTMAACASTEHHAANASAGATPVLRAATFAVDATPPVGAPIAYVSAAKIDDPLSARGIVLLPRGRLPIVLAAVDWIGNYNGGYDAWRLALAEAVGTSPDRVAMHALHQHNAPGFNLDAQLLLLAHGAAAAHIDVGFAHATIRRAADAAREAIRNPTPITHVGTGKSSVERFASNRRLLGEDGNVALVRFSSSGGDPAMRDAPEGLIDPFVRVISLWNEETPVAAMTYYATHPQIHYRDGSVTWDTVGIARRDLEERTGVFHVHFNGAGGNVTAGKYNDGAFENRRRLADRLANGISSAWSATNRRTVSEEVDWRVHAAALPPAGNLDVPTLIRKLREEPTLSAASDLAWAHRCGTGHTIPLTCLMLGDALVVHMPGELFVEYQLAAQEIRPDAFVAMAAYGDGGPGYIGTRTAYPRGGYEVSEGVSKVSPDVEDVLVAGLRDLLGVPADRRIRMPSEFTDGKVRVPAPESTTDEG